MAPRPTLEADEDGIRLIENGEAVGSMRWDDIHRITAFKRDVFTTDLICLAIESNDARGLEIDEEMPGYAATLRAMECHLPGLDTDWCAEVAFPAFSANPTVIYTRPTS